MLDNNRPDRKGAVLAAVILIFAAISAANGQSPNYKQGDRVEVDINLSSSPENMKWQNATIVEVMMWQGKISGIYVKTDEGRYLTIGATNLRPVKEAARGRENTNPANETTRANLPAANNTDQARSAFKVGDRVEVDSIMASESNGAHWVKATVTHVDIKSGRYVVRRDDFNEMTVLIRPGKIWIRHLNDGSTTPEYPTCEFYKNYVKVSNTAAPSAELFKAVIFEWANSTNRYRDFGLVFEDFKMGTPYKNRARGNGRKDVDPAPVGATIYPLKTKIVKCEMDLESTFRTEWTNEYDCYKSRVGEWVCKNGAPQNYKRSVPIPNKQE